MRMRLRKPKAALVLSIIVALLSACSLPDEINQSMNYVDNTTAYINDASAFANQVRARAEEAASNPEALDELKQELVTMKEKIVSFNAIEAPTLAKNIHNQLIGYNETLLTEINGVLENINDKVNLNALMDSEIIQTIKQIVDIQERVEQLGL